MAWSTEHSEPWRMSETPPRPISKVRATAVGSDVIPITVAWEAVDSRSLKCSRTPSERSRVPASTRPRMGPTRHRHSPVKSEEPDWLRKRSPPTRGHPDAQLILRQDQGRVGASASTATGIGHLGSERAFAIPWRAVFVIDENVFRPDGDDGEAAESVAIHGPYDRSVMRSALRRAGERCRGVDWLGREYGVDPLVDSEIDISGSNSIDHPHCKWYMVGLMTDQAMHLYLDCQSWFTAEMGDTFRRILREEVERNGLAGHAVVPPDDDEDDEDREYVGEVDQG